MPGLVNHPFTGRLLFAVALVVCAAGAPRGALAQEPTRITPVVLSVDEMISRVQSGTRVAEAILSAFTHDKLDGTILREGHRADFTDAERTDIVRRLEGVAMSSTHRTEEGPSPAARQALVLLRAIAVEVGPASWEWEMVAASLTRLHASAPSPPIQYLAATGFPPFIQAGGPGTPAMVESLLEIAFGSGEVRGTLPIMALRLMFSSCEAGRQHLRDRLRQETPRNEAVAVALHAWEREGFPLYDMGPGSRCTGQ